MNSESKGFTPVRAHIVRFLTAVLLVVLSAAIHAAPAGGKINASALDANAEYQRFIVHFDAATRGNAAEVRQSVAAVARGQGVGLNVERQLAVGAHLVGADRRLPATAANALLRAFAARAEVRYVEPDALMRPTFEPNDQFYSVQWHYFEAVGGMNLPGAWDLSTGTGVVVAVLDTGQTDHEDLVGNMVPGYDFISDTFVSRDGDLRDPDPNDEGDWNPQRNECYFGSPITNSSWHGTHVAGTVAAVTNNSIGVAGVAFGADVQHVRVLGRCGGYLSDIADGIIWASGGSVSGIPANATPASVINMSLGGGGSCGATYQAAIDTAVANGATVVVSAGNSNTDASSARPANCNNVITVAATDQLGSRASYSNYGSLVEISAPGGDFSTGNGVASTLNDGDTVQGGDIYVYYQGTSMAAPHISGLAALMYSIDPTLTPAQVDQLMQDNARPLPGSCSGGCGAGIADAEATLLAMGDPPANQPPTAAFSYVCTFLNCTFTDSSSDDGTIVSRSWNFGDGNGSTATNPSHSYAAAGTYTVTLTVTDDDGAQDSASQDVTVVEEPTGEQPPAAPSNLVADAVQEGKGRNKTLVSVDLSWNDNSNNETSFEIEACIESGKGRNKTCNFAPLTTVGANVTAWSDPDPQDGRQYRVRAVNAAGASDWSNTAKF